MWDARHPAGLVESKGYSDEQMVESKGYSDEQMGEPRVSTGEPRGEPPVSMTGSSTESGWPRNVRHRLRRDRHHEPLALQMARGRQGPGTTGTQSVFLRFSYQHL